LGALLDLLGVVDLAMSSWDGDVGWFAKGTGKGCGYLRLFLHLHLHLLRHETKMKMKK
jgi:hypothetical protein